MIDLQEAGGKYAPTGQATIDWVVSRWIEGDERVAAAIPTPFSANINLLGHDTSPPPIYPAALFRTTPYWHADAPSPLITPFLCICVTPRVKCSRPKGQRAGARLLSHLTVATQPDHADMHCLQIPCPSPGGIPTRGGFVQPGDG
ncbi:MAG: hypothetical protein IPL78_26290 [Chloroflexi bacterium]|nr:hypothetical protein [Chloroflexota bacterium]